MTTTIMTTTAQPTHSTYEADLLPIVTEPAPSTLPVIVPTTTSPNAAIVVPATRNVPSLVIRQPQMPKPYNGSTS